MTDERHIIWSDYDLDYDDWKDDLAEEFPELSEEQRLMMMYQRNGDYLCDERINLSIQMDQPIIIIADLGLWDGRHSGYKEIQSGNIADCLYSDTDYTTWYVDKLGDLRCDAIHHDGTNHYLYRTYKNGISDARIEAFQEKILRGTVTRDDINRITRRLGDEIGRVYGWSFPSKKIERSEAR